jgi:SAM-dependent methyltransferase
MNRMGQQRTGIIEDALTSPRDASARSERTVVANDAAVALLRTLKQCGYHFVTPTRDTFRLNRWRRLLGRQCSLTDIFGWSRRFRLTALPPAMLELMQSGGLIAATRFGLARSSLACASMDDLLLVHTSLSSHSADAVFFGPDSYRFVALLKRHAHRLPRGARVVDIGSGTGVGALALIALRPDLRLVVADINPAALRLARINFAAAEASAEFILSDGLAGVPGRIDAVIANPPYLGGSIGRTYRRGGGPLGADLAIDWVRQAAARMECGGMILLYTGSAISGGSDLVRGAIQPTLLERGFSVDYEEVDPDIFGRTLWLPAYRNVDRIAAVTMVATKSPGERV